MYERLKNMFVSNQACYGLKKINIKMSYLLNQQQSLMLMYSS